MPARILVVEDDQLQQSVLRSALRSRGYEVETASDGLDAVWRIRSGSYDLVLIDYLLPEMDGLATARLITDLMGDAARPRMIALTARPDAVQEREDATGQAFDGMIAKSGNIPALLATVELQVRGLPDRGARREAEAELLLKDWIDFDQASQPHQPAGAAPARPSVLIVEDDPLQQSVLKSALARFGYDVQVTSNGLDAIRIIRAGGIDLVLVDYQTPEIDGLATARLVGDLLSEETRPRLIALTATPQRLADWEKKSGKVFDEIVGKSSNLPSLFATIARALQEARETIEPM